MAVILGTLQHDMLTGTNGDDFLFGDDGQDVIGGAGGNDTIVGGLGADTLYGGAGADVFQGSFWTVTNDVLPDFTAEDSIVLTGVLLDTAGILIGDWQGPDGMVPVSFDVNLDGRIQYGRDAYLYLRPQGEPFSFVITHVGDDSHLRLISAVGEELTGDAGNNLLTGGVGNDTLRGLAGNDTLDGGPGTNRMEGGPGDDVYHLRYGLDTIFEAEGEGRDRIEFTGSALRLPDHVEDVFVHQPAGATRITGSIEGNALDNLIQLDAGLATEYLELYGFGGNDTLLGAAGTERLYGGDGNDSLSAGSAGGDWLRGGNGADTLVGGAGDDFLIGGEVDPEVTYGSYGDDRADQIYGMEGDDVIDGASGNDLLYGGEGQDTISGGSGTDTLSGQQGGDILVGGAGSDLIFGNDGDDVLNGGYAHDRLNGGAGADRFLHVGIAGHGSDWVQDYTAAEGDLLIWVGSHTPARPTPEDFQVNYADTAGAGQAGVAEAFVIYRPSGQVLWALVDGAAQGSINLQLGGQVFDLMA